MSETEWKPEDLGSEPVPAAPEGEPRGDVGDQAQRLQATEEAEAIEAALAGHPRGEDTVDRGAQIGDALEAEEADEGEDTSESAVDQA